MPAQPPQQRRVGLIWAVVVAEDVAEDEGVAVFVENVSEARFQGFWRRRGYEEVGPWPPCYWRVLCAPCTVRVCSAHRPLGGEFDAPGPSQEP